jgi:hypothetical protein
MLKRVAAAAPITRVRASDQDENYLSDVRDCPCLYCGMEPSEPAHVRFSSAAYGKTSGLGKRPESKWVLPVCAEHHRLARTAQHNRCEQEFWHSLGINPLSTCVALYAQRGDQVAMRAVVMVAIAGRDKKD